MNIAIFADNFYPEISGISDSISLTGEELGKRGHFIHFFVPFHPSRNYKFVNIEDKEINLGPNVFIHRIPSFSVPMGTLQGRIVFPNFLRSYFEKIKFDIVHTHSFWGPGSDAISLSKRQKIPLVGTNHTPVEIFSPIDNKIVKHLLKRHVINFFNKCDLVSAPSDFLLSNMKEQGLKSPGVIISNPIETSFFKEEKNKEECKKEFGLKGFIVLYVGRISQEKRVDTIIDAFLDFSHGKDDVTLVIVGEGSLRKKFEKISSSSAESKKIKFIGPYVGQNKEKLFNIFRASDIFVISSIFETQSMCTLQAMASGLPTIASRVGALPDIVNKERGLLFDVGNHEKLRDCLEIIYSNPQKREEFAKNARIFAEKLTIQNVANDWEKTYNSVIKKYHDKQ
ncbi:MAG: glycosyltransferase [Candidatus Paceibacterota bacterium]